MIGFGNWNNKARQHAAFGCWTRYARRCGHRYKEIEMSKVKTPQDKKRLSLLKDRRNSYGENSKSSRKNIPLSKQIGSQSQRSQCQKLKVLLNNGINEDFATEVEVEVATSYRQKRLNGFKKCADEPLKEHIERQLKRRGK